MCQGEEANRKNKQPRKEKEGETERGDKGRKMENDREGKGLTDLMCPLTHKAGLEIQSVSEGEGEGGR